MKGIIFDMDGTMVDNMMVHHRAWQKKLAEMGMPLELEEVHQKIHGVNEEILERLFGDKLTPEERRQHSWEKEAAYREIFLPQLRLVDGLPSFLEEVKKEGIPMAIGTAAPPENVDFVLDNLNLRSYFVAVLHARSVRHGKPNPEIYLKTAEAMGLAPEDCLVFEDSPTGAEAAYRAGSKLVVVTTTHAEKEFEQLPNVIAFIQDFTQVKLSQLLSAV